MVVVNVICETLLDGDLVFVAVVAVATLDGTTLMMMTGFCYRYWLLALIPSVQTFHAWLGMWRRGWFVVMEMMMVACPGGFYFTHSFQIFCTVGRAMLPLHGLHIKDGQDDYQD